MDSLPWCSTFLVMNVFLTPDLEKLVTDKVRSGRYNSASEVIREALRLPEERDRLCRMRLVELRREVRQGLDQLDRREGKALNVRALKRRARKEVERRAQRKTW